MSYLDKRCCGGHDHVLVQGKYTKASASYTPLLSKALAFVIRDGIIRRKRELEDSDINVKGLENQLLNEVLLSSHWTLEECWEFKSPHHINILELAAVVRLVSKLARACQGSRVVIFVESNVVKCAVNKGRSSSKALAVLLKKLGALAVGEGIYPLLVYSPTRLNPADDPTRMKDIREPVVGISVSSWDEKDIRRLSSLGNLKRFASNWSRLVIGLLGTVASLLLLPQPATAWTFNTIWTLIRLWATQVKDLFLPRFPRIWFPWIMLWFICFILHLRVVAFPFDSCLLRALFLYWSCPVGAVLLVAAVLSRALPWSACFPSQSWRCLESLAAEPEATDSRRATSSWSYCNAPKTISLEFYELVSVWRYWSGFFTGHLLLACGWDQYYFDQIRPGHIQCWMAISSLRRDHQCNLSAEACLT